MGAPHNQPAESGQGGRVSADGQLPARLTWRTDPERPEARREREERPRPPVPDTARDVSAARDRWTEEERHDIETSRARMCQRTRAAWAVRLGRALADIVSVIEAGGLPDDVEDALFATLPALDYVQHRCTAGAPVRR